MDLNNSVATLSGSRAIRIGFAAVLGLLALFLLAKTLAVFDDMSRVNPNTATITVTGTGKASAAPTIAQLYFTVQENASTVAAAQDSATKRTDNALAAIKKLGIDDKDIQTSGYNVSPQYDTRACAGGYCPPDTTKIIGYQVSQSITVKIRETGKAGEALSALGSAGVQNISGPNFMVDDDSGVQAEARKKAIDDARAKAKVLAKQLGVRLGDVVGFSESGGVIPYFGYGKGGAADASLQAAAPSLPPGENETTVNVTIQFEIR